MSRLTPASPPTPDQPGGPARFSGAARIVLLGNPNTGKTTLFNRLTGLRHKTSNFPGTTLDARLGRFDVAREGAEPLHVGVLDLPGIYSLSLRQIEAEVCREAIAGRVAPEGAPIGEPDGVLVVLDATNLGRNLVLAGEALRLRLPTVVALNMTDLARKQGLHIDAAKLAERLGCAVVPISARSGEGLDELRREMAGTLTTGAVPTRTPPGDDAALRQWAEESFVLAASSTGDGAGLIGRTFSDRADLVLTHPFIGALCFAAIMAALFVSIFTLAKFPMDWIDGLFGVLGDGAAAALPDGFVQEMVKDGVVAGVGSTLVFLPQICLLFFLISLLEDTGYLARAAFVMDRALRPFGLPGHAFVPLLSSHACALPGIMATRAIPDRRERLATILVAPFMTCSARLPVYVLLTGLLFKDSATNAALAFIGCYALGIVAGCLSAFIARRTVLRGSVRPMALELPSYKMPSLRNAFMTTLDRAWLFLRKAGTNILAICVILWWLSAFPRVEESAAVADLRVQAAAARDQARTLAKDEEKAAAQARAAAITLQANEQHEIEKKAGSFIGIIGKAVQPVFKPLGFDWKVTVGVMASFAAREVFVSTMTVVVLGEEMKADAASEDETVRARLAAAVRDDGVTPIFNRPTAWSLLVFFVLAMQCLPTLVVTARESGSAKWAVLQFAWMSGVAYTAAAIAYRLAGG